MEMTSGFLWHWADSALMALGKCYFLSSFCYIFICLKPTTCNTLSRSVSVILHLGRVVME